MIDSSNRNLTDMILIVMHEVAITPFKNAKHAKGIK